MPDFNLDDPNTWPDDIDELNKLAIDGLNPEPTPAPGDTPAPGEGEPKDPPKEEDPPQPAPGPKDEPKDEPKDKDKEPELTIDGIPVITRDGKHVIPHDVLANTRRKAQEAEARAQELEEKLKAFEQTPPAPAPAPKDEPKPDPAALPADVEAKVSHLREQWGEEIAEQYLETYRLQQDLKAQKEELAAAKATADKAANHVEQTEQQEIQAAIDASPALTAWQGTDDFNKAVSLHEFLLGTDSEYASKSWAERFEALPQRVNALYGSKLPEPVKQSDAPDANAVAEKAKAAADKAREAVPTSMTEMAAGTAAEKTEVQKLEDMSPEELQAHMTKLAGTNGALDAFLAQF